MFVLRFNKIYQLDICSAGYRGNENFNLAGKLIKSSWLGISEQTFFGGMKKLTRWVLPAYRGTHVGAFNLEF